MVLHYFQHLPLNRRIKKLSDAFKISESPFNPLNPESDQHLISPYSYMAESFIEIMRIKQMITTQRNFDC